MFSSPFGVPGELVRTHELAAEDEDVGPQCVGADLETVSFSDAHDRGESRIASQGETGRTQASTGCLFLHSLMDDLPLVFQ